MFIICGSSHLLEWRNSQESIEVVCTYMGKIIITAIDLTLLFAKLLQSSLFTIGRGLSNQFYFNTMPNESQARYYVGMDREEEDRKYNFFIQSIRNIHNKKINAGAKFIYNNIAKNFTKDERENFCDAEFEIFQFVMAKSIYIYAFGEKEKEEIPNFFKTKTKNAILDQRKNNLTEETKNKIQTLLVNPNSFAKSNSEDEIKAIILTFKKIAAEELQHSFFYTKCWPKATELFPKEK